MVVYVDSREELERLLKTRKLLLIVYSDRSDDSRSLSYAARMFERIREPIITVAIIDVTRTNDKSLLSDIDTLPIAKLYMNGRAIFEQKGSMGYYQKDFIALKEGIKSVLAGRGIRLLL